MASHIKQDYLKAIYFLDQENEEVSITQLGKLLDLSKPTVNNMVKKLQEKGWIIYEKYKPLKLTETGKKEAALIVRKHRITEMYLVKEMGFGWEDVHDIAEQIEHVESPLLFDKMDEILGYPKYDPHGAPIPDKNGDIVTRNLKKLSECNVGEKVKLKRLAHETKDFLFFLNKKQIHLESELNILSKEPYDGSMSVKYDKHQEVLSKQVCDQLLVM